MAPIAISGAAASSVAQIATAPKSAAERSESTARPSAVLKPDTVKLSAAGQANLMHREGQSVALIAAALGTDVASINGYLGITAVVAATPAPAVQAASAAAKQATAPVPQAAATEVAMAAVKG